MHHEILTMANVEELNRAPAKFRLAQREVVNGELLNVTFGPAISPPTKSATSNTAANRLPPIIEKKPMLDLWCAISRSCMTTLDA